MRTYAEILAGHAGHFGIDLNHVDLGGGMLQLHQAWKCVSPTAQKQALRLATPALLPGDQVFVNPAEILVLQVEGVVQVREGVDEVIEAQNLEAAATVGPGAAA